MTSLSYKKVFALPPTQSNRALKWLPAHSLPVHLKSKLISRDQVTGDGRGGGEFSDDYSTTTEAELSESESFCSAPSTR